MGADRAQPGTITEPLRLELEGASETSLMLRDRGFGEEATTDLIVLPALEAVLSKGCLPAYDAIACEAFVFPAGSFGVLPGARKPKGPYPFRWLWWRAHFAERLDPQNSRFLLRYRDGTIEHAGYESLDDLAQVERRAANTLAFHIELQELAWDDAGIEALDVIPMGMHRVYLSDAMADRLRSADLPGVTAVPLGS